MQAFVYMPKNEEAKKELAKRVAQVHADAVKNYINNLPISTEDKIKMVKNVATMTKS